MKNSNDIAICRLSAWLNALKIPYKYKKNNLWVKNKKGKDLRISLEDEKKVKGTIKVSAAVINNRDLTIALSEFKKIAENLGYPYTPPFDRGFVEKKLLFEDNFELISMRHCDFRRSPNPDDEELKSYKKVVDIASYKFFSINYWLCKRNGLEPDDLKSYAYLWIINFLGNFKFPTCEKAENNKKSYSYLVQKFWEFKAYLLRKERSCIPEFDSFYISKYNTVPNYEAIDLSLSRIDSYESTEDKKLRMRDKLVSMLSKLPHEEMLTKLEMAISNEGLPKRSKMLAEKLYKTHKNDCTTCKGVVNDNQ